MTLLPSSNIFPLFDILCCLPQLRDLFISVCGTDQCGKKEEVSPLHKQQSGTKNQDPDRRFRTKNIFLETIKRRPYLVNIFFAYYFVYRDLLEISFDAPLALKHRLISISLEFRFSVFISIKKHKNYLFIILHEFQDGFCF